AYSSMLLFGFFSSIRRHTRCYRDCSSDVCSSDLGDELVILLHGFPEFWYSWRHQLPVLGKRYHVIAPDMRGFNLSDKPPRVQDRSEERRVGKECGAGRG